MALEDIASAFLSGGEALDPLVGAAGQGLSSGGLQDFTLPATAMPGFSGGVPSMSIPDISTGGGGGAGNFAERLYGGVTNAFEKDPIGSLSKALGVGAQGFNIGSQLNLGKQINQANKDTSAASKAATSAAQPAVEFGTQTLKDSQAGQLPAPMQAAVEQWTQKAKADMRARYAQMGQGNSSNIASEDANIDLMAKSMIASLLQSQEGVALQGIQTGVSAAQGGAQISQQQQAMLTSLIASADQQLGRLGAAQA